jgi:predicted negative regulator of RcsB-dependent stress response
MSESLYLLSISLVLVTILLVFGMRAFSAVQQAKVRNESDEAYRQIAEKAVAAASENTTALASIQAAMADVRTRLTAIEKVLKEVE